VSERQVESNFLEKVRQKSTDSEVPNGSDWPPLSPHPDRVTGCWSLASSRMTICDLMLGANGSLDIGSFTGHCGMGHWSFASNPNPLE